MADLPQLRLYLLDIQVRPCANVSDVITGSWKSVNEGVASSGHGRIIHGFKVGVIDGAQKCFSVFHADIFYQTFKTLCKARGWNTFLKYYFQLPQWTTVRSVIGVCTSTKSKPSCRIITPFTISLPNQLSAWHEFARSTSSCQAKLTRKMSECQAFVHDKLHLYWNAGRFNVRNVETQTNGCTNHIGYSILGLTATWQTANRDRTRIGSVTLINVTIITDGKFGRRSFHLAACFVKQSSSWPMSFFISLYFFSTLS
jgi:hypothetical protein